MQQQIEQIEIPAEEIEKETKAAGESSLAEKIVQQKYRQYLKNSRMYKKLYYSTRLLAALSAGLLPFVVTTKPSLATALSIVIVLCAVTDTVFDPRSKWRLYSKATDLLAVEMIKSRGEYEKYQRNLEILLATEGKELAGLKGLEEILQSMQKGQKNPTP
ncbi:MAG: DUF4231 domain-containing protein [Nitrospiraceae bacterium]|nr:DUF4231 domain-containing protein [Nitrospiraceae bacterium]